MLRPTVLALFVVTAACAAGCGSSPSRVPTHQSNQRSFMIVLGADRYRMGPYVIDDIYRDVRATLAGSERAFGEATCVPRTDGGVSARWPAIGVSGLFYTFGAFAKPDGTADTSGTKTGCDYRDQISVDSLVFHDRRWHTQSGLHVGDSLRRMLDLFPTASEHLGKTDHPRGWWLHEIPEEVASPIRRGADLTASVVGKKVASLTVWIGAEGD